MSVLAHTQSTIFTDGLLSYVFRIPRDCRAVNSMTEENQQLLQALRNLWPILSPTARTQATQLANTIKGEQTHQ